MAIFSSKTKKEKVIKEKEEKSVNVPGLDLRKFSLDKVIINPRVTEKATIKAESNVYTFNVHKSANKDMVKKAIKKLFKVTPEKISVVRIRSKKIFARGKTGGTKSGKKAYVYLKKGDKIEFV